MTLPATVLIAAGLEWLEGLLPFLFVLFWIVSQVMNLFRAAGNGKQQKPVVIRPRPPAAPPGGNDRGVREELERQIDEFLKQATRGPADRDRAAPKPRPPKPAAAGLPAKPAVTRPAAGGPPPLPGKPGVEARRGVEAEPRGTAVSKHVQDAFSHELKHLSSDLTRNAPAAADAGPAAPTQAGQLVAMLRNPAAVRQLILMREILDRPVERW